VWEHPGPDDDNWLASHTMAHVAGTLIPFIYVAAQSSKSAAARAAASVKKSR
jgi:hypothetical protein